MKFSAHLFVIILTTITAISCKPYKAAVSNPNQLTYDVYRNQQKTFKSSDGKLSYIDKGSGQVLVLLHGVPTSGWLYRNFVDTLATKYRVIVPDMLGYGNSDSPRDYDIYSEANHAKRLIELMNHLEVNNWSHVVHDAGGLWTWELIKNEPSRIKSLVILNSIINEEGFNPPIRFNRGIMAKTAMWSYRNGFTSNVMFSKLFNNGMTQNNLNKIDVNGYTKPIKEGKTQAMYYFFTQTCNNLPEYNYHFENLNIPTKVIWGVNDDFLLWEPQKNRVMEEFGISENHVTLLNAKHFIQEEKKDEIVALLFKFLD